MAPSGSPAQTGVDTTNHSYLRRARFLPGLPPARTATRTFFILCLDFFMVLIYFIPNFGGFFGNFNFSKINIATEYFCSQYRPNNRPILAAEPKSGLQPV